MASAGRGAWRSFCSTKFSMTSASILVVMKHRYASDGEAAIGSPRMLSDVLIRSGQPVLSQNRAISL